MIQKDNTNILYWVIAVLAFIIVAWAGYLLWQNNNSITPNGSNTSSVTVTDTPLIVESWNIGLDTDDLKECIAENKYVDKINSQMKVWADNFGITWTPWNVLINNETWEYVVISGAYPKEAFIENIDKLLSEDSSHEVESDELISENNFKEITDNNSIMIISDKRDSTPVDQILAGLKEIPEIKDMTVTNYDFSDNWASEYLENNNIKLLPAVIFTNWEINEDINKFLTKLNDNAYSLNIGAKFDPFQKLTAKWFKTIDTKIIEDIKNSSYVDWVEGAKITWLEYSDLECPFCSKLHNSDVESTLKAKYGSDLNIIFNHFPLGFHQKAIPWANILECIWEQGWAEAFYKILKYAFTNEIQE